MHGKNSCQRHAVSLARSLTNLQELSLHQCIPQGGLRAIFNKEEARLDPPLRFGDWCENSPETPRTVISNRASEACIPRLLVHWRYIMRRILGIAGLMAVLMGATAVPATAQGWGYATYDEPWGAGIGVRVGGVGVGLGAPAYGAYAADYGYASPPDYAYSAAPCSCGTAANYSRSYAR